MKHKWVVRRRHKEGMVPDRIFTHFKSKEEALIFTASRNADRSTRLLNMEYVVEKREV